MPPLILFFFCLVCSSSYIFCCSVSNITNVECNSTALTNISTASKSIKLLETSQASIPEIKPNITVLRKLPPPLKFEDLPYFSMQMEIGHTCNVTTDCKIHKAICLDGTCQCGPNDTPSVTKRNCLPKAKKILDDCIEKVQCEVGLNATDLVTCVGFKCICNQDAILLDNICYKRLALGEKCTKNAECLVHDSSCIQNVCACKEGTEPDVDDSICVPMNASTPALLNCTNSQVCNVLFGDAYFCKDGSCECRPGYLEYNLTCIKELRLGEKCDTDRDCYVDLWPSEKLESRICKNNTCTCIPKLKADYKNNLCRSEASIVTSCSAIILLFLVYLNFVRTEH